MIVLTFSLKLRSRGQTGDLGAAARRAVLEVDQRGSVHALEARAAQESVLRKDYVTATHVQVCVSCFVDVESVLCTNICLQLRSHGQSGDLGVAAQRAVA